MEKIGVIGAGSWGTALAILLNENGNDVTLWSHRAEEAAKVREGPGDFQASGDSYSGEHCSDRRPCRDGAWEKGACACRAVKGSA